MYEYFGIELQMLAIDVLKTDKNRIIGFTARLDNDKNEFIRSKD